MNFKTFVIMLAAVFLLSYVSSTYYYSSSRVENGDYSEFGISAESPIKIYTVSWCKYCRALIKYLDERDLKYINVDVEKDEDAKQEFESLGGGGYPLIIVGEILIRGFDQHTIESAIEAELGE